MANDYDFYGLDPTGATEPTVVIQHGLVFGDFDSAAEGLYLITRSAPSPAEKEITEDIPYQQGSLDFSMIDEERFFKQRDLNFTLALFKEDYPNRSFVENELKRRLVPLGIGNIYDSHLPEGRHWRGKVSSITADDDAEKDILQVTITFDCYPYALGDTAEGSDVWDTFYFPEDVAQFTDFEVKSVLSVLLVNPGGASVMPTITVTAPMSVRTAGGTTISFDPGTYSDNEAILVPGENRLTIMGTGHITFSFFKEVMY